MGITIVLSLLSGVALFLFGMLLMGDGLKSAAGNKLELILYKLTSTPIKGILLGTFVTAIIQSSSATTVMVVGFVNAGMMKVVQAIGIIMGANIGTSMTGWVLCLSYIDGSNGIAKLLSTATISAIVAIVGIILRMFSKKSSRRNIGNIMLGFAILMFGMQTMSGAVSPLSKNPNFTKILTMFSNPLLGILIGIVFTAILQSASASVGILQALSITGSVSFATALPIIMGIGVGAACPVLLSSIGTNKNGKRTALIYLLNDLFGLTIWSILFYSVNHFVHFDFMDLQMTPVRVALVNSIFRTATVIVLCPFIGKIEKLVFFLIKDSDEDKEEQADFDLLEERFLNYPDIAIAQSYQAMNGMTKTVRKNLMRSLKLLNHYTENTFQKVKDKEMLIDKYEDKLGTYLMKITKHQLSGAQSRQVSMLLHTVGDFERLGDYANYTAEAAAELYEKKITFSEQAQKELGQLYEATKEIITLTAEAFANDDSTATEKVEPLRKVIGLLCDELKVRHVDRLQSGICSFSQGFVFNDIITNMDHIATHCSNIVVAIGLDDSDYDPHGYLKNVRKDKSGTYKNCFEEYEIRFKI